jgi:hypothetical protein
MKIEFKAFTHVGRIPNPEFRIPKEGRNSSPEMQLTALKSLSALSDFGISSFGFLSIFGLRVSGLLHLHPNLFQGVQVGGEFDPGDFGKAKFDGMRIHNQPNEDVRRKKIAIAARNDALAWLQVGVF